MKKLLMVMAVALALVGCSKESKFESLMREIGEVSGESKAEIDREVEKALKDFREMTDEEQDQAIKMMEAALEMAKAAAKLQD